MNIVIIGGGTSGWITALYAKKARPFDNITLIESSDIGILGAGEGTTPQIVHLLDFLEIPASDILKHCNGTIKTSIRFTGWSGPNTSYHHPFLSRNGIATKTPPNRLNVYLEKELEDFFIYNSFFNNDRKSFILAEDLEDTYKLPFVKKFFEPDFVEINPIQRYEFLSDWALHFDANLLSKFLKETAISRGVNHVIGLVTNINQDIDGSIKSLNINDSELYLDFVFDCSGFNSFITKNIFKTKRVSHRDSLPANKAQGFFLNIESNKMPCYTESVCMDYGWMWKIPLQHRYGCGYVYSDEFISEQDVLETILKKYPDAKIGKSFSFPEDHLFNIWNKNCLSVGLSTGFLEPLEATSIFHIIRILNRFFSEPTNILSRNYKNIDLFNHRWRSEIQEIIDFIYLHYMSNGTGSNFWKNFKKLTKKPEFIDYIIDISRYRIPNQEDFFGRELFTYPSYTHVLYGNKILTDGVLVDYMSNIKYPKVNYYLNSLKNQKQAIDRCVPHKDFIDDLINDSPNISALLNI